MTRQTIPVRFEEMQEGGALGLAIPDSEYTSSNARRATCRPIPPTRLSRYAFAHQGITLDARVAMTVTPKAARARLSGRYDGTHPNVTIHYKRIAGGDWKEECVALDGGRFDVDFDWASAGEPGFYWFMITGSDDQCRSPGWSWSYKIKLVGEQAPPAEEDTSRDEPKIGANTSRGSAVDPPGSLSYSRERGARLPRIPTTQDPDKGTQ